MTIDAGEPQPQRTIGIVGGGASGTLTAVNLLRRGARVVLFESRGEAGLGVAYSTSDGRHLLNVRANNMSGFPDAPGDLLDWASEAGIEIGTTGFLPRRDYSRYLRDRLAQAAAEHPDALEVVPATVTDVEPAGAGFSVVAEEKAYVVDAVVLAYGNPAPRPLSGLPEASWSLADPWDIDRLTGLPVDATVLVVGTGLTAVDTAVTLLGDAERRRVLMVSRHGLLPQAHVDDQFTAWVSPIPDGPLTADQIVKIVTEQLDAATERGVDWRAVIDGLRGPTQSIWRRLDADERRVFLERYAREWEVRRHRMAPAVAALLDGYREAGRLEILGGGVAGVEEVGETLVAHLADGDREIDAVVNCTGPSPDLTRTDNPLLLALQRRGLITPDPLRLGLACTETGEVLDADGEVVRGLLTVGPPRKGTLYETTAVPEIRRQAAEVAALLT